MNPIVPLLALSLVALVALTGLMVMLMRMSNLIQAQNFQIRSLSNLTASKDLGAFMAMETTNSPKPYEETEFAPLDDISVAERLAGEYSDHGIDPFHAYAKEDDDPLADFGGRDVFN